MARVSSSSARRTVLQSWLVITSSGKLEVDHKVEMVARICRGSMGALEIGSCDGLIT